MSSKSMVFVSFFIFLVIIGFISHKRNVNYLTYSLKVPQNCKATTGSNITCQDYQLYWHYTEKKSQASLVKQFADRLLYKANSVLVDTIHLTDGNPALSTLIFQRDSKIIATISHGMIQNRYVVIVFEPSGSISSIEALPEFVKNLLSLS